MRFVFYTGTLLLLPFLGQSQALQQYRQTQEKNFDDAKRLLTTGRYTNPFSQDSSSVSFAPWLEGNQLYFLSALNADAAAGVAANQLLDTNGSYALTGAGIRCGIWEDGLIANHQEFDTRILSKEGTSPKFHATHVAGTILAKGIVPAAKGLAPNAQAYTYFFDNDLAEMAALQETNTAKVSNHSYGTTTGWSRINGTWFWFGDAAISTTEDYKHGFYSTRTKAIDALAYLVPDYTIVWPAGNDRGEPGDGTRPADCNQGTGYDCIITEAVAKNVITVGAVNKFTTYTSPLSVPMSSFSSFGPTDDGRIKPDVVAPGVTILSTSAASNTQYLISSGTSMAAPVVTGAIVLLQELHKKLTGKNFARSSTVKALLIHTAKEAGAQQGPDYSFGWGLVDAEAAASFLLQKDKEGNSLLERNLQQGETHDVVFQPKANSKITITLCWTDPEGNPVAPILDPTQRMLVHDLDIRLLDDQGNVHFPWILNPTIPQAQAARGDNTRDNVEKIEVESALNRTYTLSVRHKGNLNIGGQTYSLLISYTPALPVGKKLYRIGAGNWNDPSRWSFTSGGTSANVIPGENDCVIIDNKSLQNGETLTAASNIQVKQCLILNNKNVTFNLASNSLTISKNLSVSASGWTILNGQIVLSGNGTAAFETANLNTTDITVENGNWQFAGKVNAHTITVKANLTMAEQTEILANEWKTTASSAVLFNTSKITASLVTWLGTHQATDLVLIAQPTSSYNFDNNNFEGKIIVPAGTTCNLTNTATLNHVSVYGTIQVLKNATIKKLDVENNSSINLTNEVTLLVEEECNLNNVSVVSFTSSGKGFLRVNAELQACLQNATITNVDLLGNAAISLTGNSTLTGATGWQTVACADFLQAKFSLENVCAEAWVQTKNESAGNPESFLWTTTFDTEFNNNIAEPDFIIPQATSVTITLRITKDNRSHEISKTFTVSPNTLPENEIVLANGRLISLQQAPSYTWLLNREIVPQTNARILPVSDLENKQYEVVIADGTCTRISKPFIVTDTENLIESETIPFPNPTNGFFTLKKINGKINKQDWILTSTEGRQFTFNIINSNTIDVSHVPQGVYFFQNKRKKQTYRIVVVGH